MNRRLVNISATRSLGRLFHLVCIMIFLTGCHSEESAKGKKAEVASAGDPPAEVFSLKKGRLSSSLQIPGELVAWQQVDRYAKVNSFVKKLYVDVGSEV